MRTHNDYIAPKWNSILQHNNLSDFKSIWKLEADWFETPNLRRGGWSGVNKISLKLPAGGTANVFLKRQQNQHYRRIRAPFSGSPTYEREFRNIMRYTKTGVNTLFPIYFAMKTINNHRCAILITEELVGYKSLEEWIPYWQDHKWPSIDQRNRLFAEIATQIRLIHNAGFKHCCLYPKHILIRIDNNFEEIEVKIIDLEKSRYYPYGSSRIRRDLYTIKCRCILNWTRSDQMRFMLMYLNLHKLTRKSKILCRKIMAHEQKRNLKKNLTT